jgi:hypothetical protein
MKDEIVEPGVPGTAPATGLRPGREPGLVDGPGELSAAQAVTALYEGHALALIRLAYLMLGDRHAAEDVVQDAFCGLYRAWDRLPGGGNPSATCGSPWSMAAARCTAGLRFYADLSEQEVARVMGVSRGTVKSTTARGMATLGRILREEQ